MKLSVFKNILQEVDKVSFRLEDSSYVPAHFHVTEVGCIEKRFIDCGGVVRVEKNINFQLWSANDIEHRLKPLKLLNIIKLSERKLDLEDSEIEVEYQGSTIGKYSLEFNGTDFILTNKTTACLAPDSCGITVITKEDENHKAAESCCSPGSGCC